MKSQRTISQWMEIGLRVQGNTDRMKMDEMFAEVEKIVQISGMICYVGWNYYFKCWNWGFKASKPSKEKLMYLVPMRWIRPLKDVDD